MKHAPPWVPVGAKVHGGTESWRLLAETARSGPATELSVPLGPLGPWRRPLATYGPGKIVLGLGVAVALDGDAAWDVALLRAPRVLGGGLGSDGALAGHRLDPYANAHSRRSPAHTPSPGSGAATGSVRRSRTVGA